jgi:hypothetical protein
MSMDTPRKQHQDVRGNMELSIVYEKKSDAKTTPRTEMPETASADASFGALVAPAPPPVAVEEPLPPAVGAGREAPLEAAPVPDGVGRLA